MAKTALNKLKVPTLLPHGLPDAGKLVGFVVGIEDYQPKSKIPAVEFARNDAEAIAEALRAITTAPSARMCNYWSTPAQRWVTSLTSCR